MTDQDNAQALGMFQSLLGPDGVIADTGGADLLRHGHFRRGRCPAASASCVPIADGPALPGRHHRRRSRPAPRPARRWHVLHQRATSARAPGHAVMIDMSRLTAIDEISMKPTWW